MEWNHLPRPGGLLDQDPLLLMQWEVIWSKEAEHQRKKKQQKARTGKGSNAGPWV